MAMICGALRLFGVPLRVAVGVFIVLVALRLASLVSAFSRKGDPS
jgi:hypothetical protein